MFYCHYSFCLCIAANVLQIDVGGLSELPVSTRTNVYLKINVY